MNGRVLVVSPWGLAGGYSGPLTLMNRLFGGTGLSDVAVDVIYRDRGNETIPGWADTPIPLLASASHVFTRTDQLRWLWRLLRYLLKRSDQYDAVHLHGCYLPNLVPSLFISRGVKIVLFPVLEEGDLRVTGRGANRWFKQFVTGLAVSRAEVGFALSEGIANELTGHGLDANRVVRLGNPVSAKNYAFPEGRPLPLPGTVRLGFVGKLGETKQPHLLLQALSILRRYGLTVSATFVGPYADDTYRLKFERMREALQLSNDIKVTGYTESVPSFVKHEMDVFVLASKAEGMPGALAEAMMSGLPCVVTDIGAMGDTIRTAQCGLVVAPSADAIATAVARLCGDVCEWTRTSSAAAAFASSHYSDDGVSRRYSEGVLYMTKTS